LDFAYRVVSCKSENRYHLRQMGKNMNVVEESVASTRLRRTRNYRFKLLGLIMLYADRTDFNVTMFKLFFPALVFVSSDVTKGMIERLSESATKELNQAEPTFT